MKRFAVLLTTMLCSVVFATDKQSLDEQSTYERVLLGKKCDSEITRAQNFYCAYAIGDGFLIHISDIGKPGSTILFTNSNNKGDFFAAFQMRTGCVVVSPGQANESLRNKLGYAWISPKTGKVYDDARECKYSH
jgi:hypothetical protein